MNLLNLPVAATAAANEMANPRVSYYFDDSVPYSKRQRQKITREILEEMLVMEGPNIPVKVLPHESFIEMAEPHRREDFNPDTIAAFWSPSTQEIIFNGRAVSPRNWELFMKLLEHELGHAIIGIDHVEEDKSIMNPTVSIWSNVTDEDKARIRESRGY